MRKIKIENVNSVLLCVIILFQLSCHSLDMSSNDIDVQEEWIMFSKGPTNPHPSLAIESLYCRYVKNDSSDLKINFCTDVVNDTIIHYVLEFTLSDNDCERDSNELFIGIILFREEPYIIRSISELLSSATFGIIKQSGENHIFMGHIRLVDMDEKSVTLRFRTEAFSDNRITETLLIDGRVVTYNSNRATISQSNESKPMDYRIAYCILDPMDTIHGETIESR
jgi:hypothetical protein